MASNKKPTKTINLDIKTDEDRQKALETTLTNIEKQFGKGAVMKLGDSANRENIPVIPTGAISLDIGLGVGGIPRGRIIEVFGPEASGKTTVALHIVAETQKIGGICGYIDAEHALDPIYAKNLGVNIDELYISQPDDGEQALEITEAMVRSSVIDLIVVDSVAALTPRAEIEGNMGESHMGLHARLMSQALRKMTAFASKTNCTIIFINQLRATMGGGGYGPSETTTGGRALKFYASVRLDIRRDEYLKVGDSIVGIRAKVKVAKNKVAPPFKLCFFDIMYGKGISKEGDVLDLATDLDIATKSGAWYSYNGERMGQGRENVKTYLKEHPEVFEKLAAAIREHFELKAVTTLELPSKEESDQPAGSAKGKKAKGKTAKAEPEEAAAPEEEDNSDDDGEEIIELEHVSTDEDFDGGDGMEGMDEDYDADFLDEMVFEDEP